MSNHEMRIISKGSTYSPFYAYCICGWVGEGQSNPKKAGEDYEGHKYGDTA